LSLPDAFINWQHLNRAGKRKADDASSQPAAKKAKTADSSSDDSDSEVIRILFSKFVLTIKILIFFVVKLLKF
jgi:hypothetical protein